eukprot:scaffold285405_cov32-Tisochrysis_lutea.AAC.3
MSSVASRVATRSEMPLGYCTHSRCLGCYCYHPASWRRHILYCPDDYSYGWPGKGVCSCALAPPAAVSQRFPQDPYLREVRLPRSRHLHSECQTDDPLQRHFQRSRLDPRAGRLAHQSYAGRRGVPHAASRRGLPHSASTRGCVSVQNRRSSA